MLRAVPTRQPPARGTMERFCCTLRAGCIDHLGAALLHDVQLRAYDPSPSLPTGGTAPGVSASAAAILSVVCGDGWGSVRRISFRESFLSAAFDNG